MNRIAYIFSLILFLAGCAHKNTAMDETIIKSAEEGIKYLEAHPPSGASFQLTVSDSFTFVGKPDKMGAGMAILTDKILSLGYVPDGFDQKSGFKLCRYKKMQARSDNPVNDNAS